ncbi:tripartite tricarboxylate transporter TctB family protein [Kangiella sp.]|uniref:tripartite tricarboxylate transporter TctB family protein n=1 Tax=Kangiella sp. TaxID=1920245 RepID=UPI003A8FCF4E
MSGADYIMNISRYKDILVGLVFLLGSIAYYCQVLNIEQAGFSKLGPDFVPKVIAGLTFVLGLVQTIKSIYVLRQKNALQSEGATDGKKSFHPVVMTFVLLLIYVFSIEPIGFIPASAIYLYLQLNVSVPDNQRGIKYQAAYLLSSVAAAVLINFLFVNSFNVMLPQGLLD